MHDLVRHCLFCGRAYSRQAKPLWVFWQDGRCAGSAHSACAMKRSGGRTYLYGGYTSRSVEAARADLWFTRLRTAAPTQSTNWYAGMLFAHGYAGVFNDQQWQLLAYWEWGPLKLSAAYLAEIQAAYRALVAEYTAWRATLPAGQG